MELLCICFLIKKQQVIGIHLQSRALTILFRVTEVQQTMDAERTASQRRMATLRDQMHRKDKSQVIHLIAHKMAGSRGLNEMGHSSQATDPHFWGDLVWFKVSRMSHLVVVLSAKACTSIMLSGHPLAGLADHAKLGKGIRDRQILLTVKVASCSSYGAIALVTITKAPLQPQCKDAEHASHACHPG